MPSYIICRNHKAWSLTVGEEHKLRVFEENIWTKEGWSDRRVEKAA
jgi:hypothetical protein